MNGRSRPHRPAGGFQPFLANCAVLPDCGFISAPPLAGWKRSASAMGGCADRPLSCLRAAFRSDRRARRAARSGRSAAWTEPSSPPTTTAFCRRSRRAARSGRSAAWAEPSSPPITTAFVPPFATRRSLVPPVRTIGGRSGSFTVALDNGLLPPLATRLPPLIPPIEVIPGLV